MKQSTLTLLRCPVCRHELTLRDALPAHTAIQEGNLSCASCNLEFPIHNGMPRFVQPEELSGLNRRFERFYALYSKLYRPLSVIATFYLGGERNVRSELLGRLPAPAGLFLDVSIGSGRNLPFIINSLQPTQVFGIDISLDQLDSCRIASAQRGWDLELAATMAEALPYADDSFDTVLHVGGINFFSDPARALSEMVRVAKPGAHILVADETERAARIFDWVVPGFAGAFEGKRPAVVPPAALLPANVEDVRTEIIWRGMAYCLQFRKSIAKSQPGVTCGRQ